MTTQAENPATNNLGSGAMFDHIAPRYDRLNRILSLGGDRRWRRACAAALGLTHESRVADIATGTGDLAFEILAQEPGANVVGIDPSPEMLAVGRRKATGRGMDDRLTLMSGDAQALPLADDEVDAACMAFGIRNVVDRARALGEMARVVRPGGRIAILELSEPQGRISGPAARLYVHHVVPRVGALLSGAREYRYLERSIAKFPAPAEFAAMMEAAGIDVVSVRRFSFGACCLFVGQVPGARA